MQNDNFYLSNEDYDKGVSLMIRLCLDFIIVKDNKVLLSKREIEPYKGFWHLPGGMVKKGESIKQAAERIITSELSLKPLSMEMAGYIEYLDEKIPDKGISTHSVSIAFKTVLETGEIKGSFQAKEIKFFSDIPDGIIPEMKDFLNKNWDSLTN